MTKKPPLWLRHELMKLVHTLGTHYGEPLLRNDDVIAFTRNPPPAGEIEGSTIPPLVLTKAVMPRATVFDCRQLPDEFAEDTGQSVIGEPRDVRGPILLPFPCCYFEFEDRLAVLAYTPQSVEDDDDWEVDKDATESIRVEVFADTTEVPWHNVGEISNAEGWLYSLEGSGGADALFYDGGSSADPEKVYPVGSEPTPTNGQKLAQLGIVLLIGTLALMKERLVTETFVPDPKPWLSKTRAKKGKYPISGPSYVVNVNVPAVRRMARTTALGAHESPALHWRRGHWRVLHRGSEFEGTTWVRKCLVGDPSKGYVRKDYRLTMQPPMLVPREPELPALVGEESK